MLTQPRQWILNSLCLCAFPYSVIAVAQGFDEFVASLANQAKAQGVNANDVDAIAAQVKLFRKASTASTPRANSLEIYIPSQVTEQKASAAEQFYQQYRAPFNKLSQQYGVQPRFILAQWAMLGSFTGDDLATYPLASVTASYAYQGENQFTAQFIAALRLIANGGYPFDDLVSNTDGTMGPMRFTATMLLHCAVDGDGDGKIDVWHNPLDIYASTASCWQQNGWDESQTWGRQVRAPKALYPTRTGMTHQASFVDWQAAGVRRYDGRDLPNRRDMTASLIMPDGVKGRQYIVYKNYRILYQQHPDDYLVLAIAHLSERIKKLGVD
ncbi:hypothetical protein HR45_15920 [Shewanella mangrovi]|uniref:Transglycosylase SLT domain-containing protein n=1 Tax=Shewanella mangrovi TaxID=1515746 RepID=A0A094JEK4_9GAMM|nr:lytic murein transglycosylase [Shewanella mangrovi]KFZ36469.1 hypothetical protein HR45_15920 [Shewanella mangrovi]